MAYNLPQVKRVGIGKLTFWEAKKPKSIEELKDEKEFLEARQRFREEVKKKTAEKEKLEGEIAHLKGEDKKVSLMSESFKKELKKEARIFMEGAEKSVKKDEKDFTKGYTEAEKKGLR